jgi:hypothetical protein
MTTPRDIAAPLDRITWRNGQLLTAADLRDEQARLDRLRYLHVRYQHRTWGIVGGFSVAAAGTEAVHVGRGYALDIEGRDLLLPGSRTLQVPAGTAAGLTMYLVISWDAGSSCCASTPDLKQLCPGKGNPLLLEQGALAWKTVEQVRMGYDVLLARVLVSNGELASEIDTTVQRRASSLGRSRVWSDVTLAGQTGWANRSAMLPELIVDIDTSDAGYIATPAYFAQLTGSTHLAQTSIESATATGFRFVVRLATPDKGFQPRPVLTAAGAESAGLTVSWFAVEFQKGFWT